MPNKKFNLFLLAIASCLLFSCGNSEDAGNMTEQAGETESAPEEIKKAEPRFRQYILEEEELAEPVIFKGNMHVVVGKNGYLYENGYINEYTGGAPKYINVTDEQLTHRVSVLRAVQEELEERGIAFCVVITPSKAGSHPEFIPDFHIEKYPPLDKNYVRPYVRFKKLLEDKGVYFVDSATVYESVGITRIFPKTGIHWNFMAALETVNAVAAEYERQRGFEIKRLIAESIQSSPNPFGAERDIFGILYTSSEGRDYIEAAIVDDKYYQPEVFLETGSKPKIGKTLLQGGSFTGEFNRYLGGYLAESVRTFYYNNGDNTAGIDWKNELKNVDFVLLEVNEHFVYNMGGNAPAWGQDDIDILPLGSNFIDALWDYLENNPE